MVKGIQKFNQGKILVTRMSRPSNKFVGQPQTPHQTNRQFLQTTSEQMSRQFVTPNHDQQSFYIP